MGAFIGIDLGTTYSAVAHINAQGKAEIIPNEFGKATTPSVIAFDRSTSIVGEPAKERQASGDPEVAAFFKRHMGEAHYSFTAGGLDYNPTELSTIILKYMKGQAEHYLKQTVTDAVITVPAYFDHKQRQETIKAGRDAGLNVLQVFSEPTAAALAFGLRPGIAPQKQRVLVYDLGGGTFDVSLVEITATDLEVLATDGDHNLGGKDWDDRLLTYLEDLFQQEFNIELIGDDITALQVEVEHLKHTLSTRQNAQIRVHSGGDKGIYTVSRLRFEDLTRDLMERTKLLSEQVLTAANLQWSSIDGILPIGGSTRMPMVSATIRKMLNDRPPMTGVNPDEAVALGAALKAALEKEKHGGEPLQLRGRKRTKDVIAHSLGMIAVSDDGERYINSILIRKNRSIPLEQQRSYKLPLGRRGYSQLEVFLTQGESDNPQHCSYLGRYVFDNFPFLPGQTHAMLDITYKYNESALVEIKAVERTSNRELQLSIEPVPTDVPARFMEKPRALRAPQDDVTVYLAFDLSGSMKGEPLAAAKRAAEEFVHKCNLDFTSIGLISFSDEVLVNLSATRNIQEILRSIRQLSVGRTGWGNGAQPFTEIHSRLAELPGNRYTLVLTDGRWYVWNEAIREAKRCHAAQIEVIAVGFGKAQPHFLNSIASSPDQGRFVELQNLSETYSSIAQEIREKTDQDINMGRLIQTNA